MTTTNIIKSMGAADIDTKELTTNLVAATKGPRQKLIDLEKTKADVAISNIALLKNGLSSLQQAATAIAKQPPNGCRWHHPPTNLLTDQHHRRALLGEGREQALLTLVPGGFLQLQVVG